MVCLAAAEAATVALALGAAAANCCGGFGDAAAVAAATVAATFADADFDAESDSVFPSHNPKQARTGSSNVSAFRAHFFFRTPGIGRQHKWVSRLLLDLAGLSCAASSICSAGLTVAAAPGPNSPKFSCMFAGVGGSQC